MRTPQGVTVRWPDSELRVDSFAVQAGHRFHIVQGLAPALAQ